MSKVYIVPTQTPGEDGGLQNVNWVPERNDVFFDFYDGEFGYDHILMSYVVDDVYDSALYTIDEEFSPTSQRIVIGFNPNLQKYVAFTGGGALSYAEISSYYDDEKNYIVPTQESDSNGVVRNVNWVAGRNDVIATVPGSGEELIDIPMTFNPDGNGSYYGEVMEGVTLSIGFADGIDAYTVIAIQDGQMSAVGNLPISLWYPAGSDDPDDPDKKPDNIEDHTATKNQVIEENAPAQVRSQVNWMDRVEEIAVDILGADPLDYRARSIEKYLDAIDGRRNLDPIIRINKDIEKPEDNSDDSTEDLSANA